MQYIYSIYIDFNTIAIGHCEFINHWNFIYLLYMKYTIYYRFDIGLINRPTRNIYL